MNIHKVFLLVITVILIGCKCKKDVTKSNSVENSNNQVLYEPADVINGTHGGYDTAKFLVIKEEETMHEVYNYLNRIRKPGFKKPIVDFDEEMVIALFMGKKNAGGYNIAIDSINEYESHLEIIVSESTPQENATMVITKPFYVCKIKRTDKEILFKKKE